MKIGIFSDRLNRPRTGIGNYVYNLIDQFDKGESIKDDIVLINYEKINNIKNLEQLTIENPLYSFGSKSFYFWHIYLQSLLRTKDFDLDVIHSPENATPFISVKPNKVLTVHDITPYFFPESFSPLTLYRYKFFFSKAIKTSDKIIVVSASTKNDLIKYYKIDGEKISVIHLGVSETFRCLDEAKLEEIKCKFKISFPFLLYVGTIEPRKNLYRLLLAFFKIKKVDNRYKLIIIGARGWKFEKVLKIINNLDLQKDVIFAGYVTDYELVALYNAADLFVYPSLYEGFGLPPLEAMACGCPVITSGTSSLPEVIGDAGIMVDPYNVDDLANAILEVVENEGLRYDLIGKGIERSKSFSWKKCATETLGVYREVIS